MKIEHDLGYIGNIWVRQNVLKKAGESTHGHYHLFDHVSLLATGSVEVQIDGHPPKIFVAPTFIVIKKEHSHKFTAVTDDVLWYCVFAIRDEDGELSDIAPESNSPYFIEGVSGEYWKNRLKLEKLSIEDSPHASWSFNERTKMWTAPVPYPVDGKLYKWDESALSWSELHE